MANVFKSYSQFVNESFFPDDIARLGQRAIKAIKKFMGNGANYLNSLVYQSTGKISNDGAPGTIPNGVFIFPSQTDIAELSKAGITPVIPSAKTVFGVQGINRAIKADDPEEIPTATADDDNVEEAAVQLTSDPKSGIKNVHEEELWVVMRRKLKHPEGLPLMVWGAPGIAKTAIVKRAQKEYGGRLIDLQLTTYAPEDFFLPKEDADAFKAANKYSARATRIPQDWLPVYHESEGQEGDARANGIDGAGGVLFLDELSRAKEAIRNVCLKLVHEKKMDGGWIVGSRWRIMAASNRPFDDPTNQSEFGQALANRFTNYNFVPTIKDFSKYAMSAKDEQGKDLFDPRIISFLNWTKGQEFFHKMDPDAGNMAFPSPRTWEEAATSWKNAKSDAKEESRQLTNAEVETAIAGAVGEEAAKMFMGYYELSQKIDLDKLHLVYTDPNAAPLPPKKGAGFELDSAYILASAIAYEKRNTKLTINEFENVVKYAVRVGDPTVAMQILQALLDIHPYLNADIRKNPDSMVADYAKILGRLFLPAYPGSARDVEKMLANVATTDTTTP